MKVRRGMIVLLILVNAVPAVRGAVWQYSVTVGPTRSRVDLYIPPRCERLRGAVIALDNLVEKSLLEDAIIREAAQAEDLALIWIARGPRGRPFNRGFRAEAGDSALLDEMLTRLAETSGYAELASAPLLPIGHSAGVPFAWELAMAEPSRIIGVIPFKSGLPGHPTPGSVSRIAGVPVLIVKGQFEEWSQPGGPTDRQASWRSVHRNALGFRSRGDRSLVGFLLDVGGGHFESSEALTRILALFIRKAARARIPSPGNGAGPSPLKPIDPGDGWLTDSAVGLQPDRPVVAGAREFAGDRGRSFWYLDRELAEAVRSFGEAQGGKADPMATFATDGEALPLSGRGIVEIPFRPGTDGRTFRLSGAFFEKVPEGVLGQSEPLGRPDSPARVLVVKGPARQVGPDTFRLQFDRDGPGGDLWLIADHPGDARFRHAVQAGRIQLSKPLNEGHPQGLTFPEIPDQPVGTPDLDLNARSDSGLPVEYAVVTGPAEVVGRTLHFTPIPPRSRYPVEVTVVARQWGRTVEPLYRSAEPISRTFHLTRTGRD